MNYLAHLFLSGQDPEVLFGNFIGDFVKGQAFNDYPEGIRKGILLHREIDHFTDHHEVVKESKKRLWDTHRHYAPVIVDVFYDHFLAKDWDQYSPLPLKAVTEAFYETLRLSEHLLPPKAKNMFFYMSRDNWLYHYQYVEGVHRALSGMASRTKFPSGMELSVNQLKKHYDAFHKEFRIFFPQLVSHAQNFLASN